MKRIQMCKKVNRNDPFNSNLSDKLTQLNAAVNPEILVGQVWLQDEPAGVEIIELNTSDENDHTPVENMNDRMDHAWSYSKVETLQQLEDKYKINQKARERRRLQQNNRFFKPNTTTNTHHQYTINNYDSDSENQYSDDNHRINHQVNCFTIINNPFTHSDTSSDDDLEIITADIMESNRWDSENRPYKEKIITYDPDLDNDTRTIWIYSFKNKHLLTDDDFDCGKTAVRDFSTSTTSCSTENGEEEKTKDKSTNVCRLGSPIPPAYIPRLNLSFGPTLSTVTEVSETNKQNSASPNPSFKSSKNILHKPKNAWFKNEMDKLDSERSPKNFEKSTNIINWMALSPREKIRRSKEQGDKWEGSILKLETFRNEEILACNPQELITRNSIPEEDKAYQENAFRLQVDVDVHVSVNEKTPDKRSMGTPNGTEFVVKSKVDDKSPNSLLQRPPFDIKSNTLDRGDHIMKLEHAQQVDHDLEFGHTQQVVHVTPHVYETKPIPDDQVHLRVCGPIDTHKENILNNPDLEVWEREEREEKETASYDYLTDNFKYAVKDPDLNWMKNNTPFLQPSKWDDYASIADSYLTIQMSINEEVPKRKTWFMRAFKRIIICCQIKSKK